MGEEQLPDVPRRRRARHPAAFLNGREVPTNKLVDIAELEKLISETSGVVTWPRASGSRVDPEPLPGVEPRTAPVRAYALAIPLGIVVAIWVGNRRWVARR